MMTAANKRSKRGSPATVLNVGEDLTIYSAARLKQLFLDALKCSGPIEIDLSTVTEMDTVGVQLLVAIKREGSLQGRNIHLVGHSPTVVAVLDLYSLSSRFGDPVVLTSAA